MAILSERANHDAIASKAVDLILRKLDAMSSEHVILVF